MGEPYHWTAKMALPHQLPYHLPTRQNRDRAAAHVVEVVGGVDAEAGVDGGEQVVAVHRPLDGVFALGVSAADDLAHAEAAAGEEDAHGPRPVVAARAAGRI